MIAVAQQPEPANFDTDVRQPGKQFLDQNPNPSGKEFKKHGYWSRVTDDLMSAYQNICAYTCWYLVKTTAKNDASVDHFKPKDKHRLLAYEWSNYRLASQRVNNHKGNSEDVLDPFEIETGWFVLDFPSCLVIPGDDLPDIITTDEVLNTIKALKLNEYEEFVDNRLDIMMRFGNSDIEMAEIEKRYPFIASEITRQNLSIEDVKLMFKNPENK